MRRGLVLTLATAAALVSASAATGAGGPACGDPITADLVLEADLIGCSTGLVVAADDITIDLNGHLIEGQSSVAGAGVEAVERSGITIKNGRVSGFASGVLLTNTSRSTVENLVVRNTAVGIHVGSGGAG